MAIREVQRDELVAARNLATLQETLIRSTRQILVTLARSPQVQRRDRDACNALFAELLGQCPYYAVLVAADPEGQVFASAPAAHGPVNIRGPPLFSEDRPDPDFCRRRTGPGPHHRKYSLNLSYPDSGRRGRLQGVLTAGVDLNWLGSQLAKSDFPPSTALVLTDSTGKVLFRYPEPLKYIGKMLPDFLIKAMTAGDEGVAEGVGLPGDARLFAFARLSPPWQEMRLLIGLPRNGPLLRLIGTCGAISSGWVWWRFWPWPRPGLASGMFIVRPVRKLRQVTDRLAAGT